jgi:hypothetical protein
MKLHCRVDGRVLKIALESESTLPIPPVKTAQSSEEADALILFRTTLQANERESVPEKAGSPAAQKI